MAEARISSGASTTKPDGPSDYQPPALVETLFHRRIDFLPARKPFTGFSNGGGGFRLETLNPQGGDSQRGSNQGSGSISAGKKADGSEFLDAGLDPELSFSISFKRIGAGLENLGNTCFLNSVLQCLTYTEPLAAYLQSGKHKYSCRTAGFCALCAIQNHVSRALQLTGRILAPKDLVSNLRCISRNFRNARQEDAHEYMVNLLESMHKCCLPAGVPSESPSAYEKSLVHKIFGGSLRSQVKCMQCSFCSNKFDPFLDLSLEINKAESLYKAIVHFTTKEYLDGGERQYQCQKCKQKVKALKQLTIYKAPYVLTIHLKRFGAHQPGQKIDRKVQFDPTLDLKSFVSGPYDGDLRYTLYGVLVHDGWSTHSGHYYCFVRTSSGMWYSLNDHQVRQVSEKMVLEQKAYMLFYVRDRTNFAPKKSVDVVQKESMVINSAGSKGHSNLNHGPKEMVRNVPVHIRSNDVNSYSAVGTQKDAVAAPLVLMKEAHSLKMQETSVVKNDPPNRLCVLHQNGGEQVTQRNPVKGFDDILSNVAFASTSSKFKERKKEISAKEDPCDLVAVAANCCGPHNSATKKDPRIGIVEPEKYKDRNMNRDPSDSVAITPSCNGHSISAGDTCLKYKTSQKEIGEKVFNKIELTRPLDQLSYENGWINDSSKKAGLGDGGQRVEVTKLEGLSRVGTTHVLLLHEALDPKSQPKLKKKLLKYHIAGAHLSSSILFRASLRLQKKKLKKVKKLSLKIKNNMKEHLLEGSCSPTDLGPSTSEGARTFSGNSIHFQRKELKSVSIKKDKSASAKNAVVKSGYDSAEGVLNGEFGHSRLGQNGAVLATNKQHKSTSFAGSQLHDQGFEGLKDSRGASVRNGLMNMLTRGLEETIVAHWDEIELPSSHIAESRDTETISIGYIGDEWDEEYDRGKRKKVRSSQNGFGGANPFQEVASRKAKLNHHYISGNQPFRI
ncbi:LOW QUALITY PROTEIN: ubiquitin carboxyl-terminal hydrolase 23 [Diospyros lotus]|uniref:LOW QUALITY PROTEIN: ubiquitin carboxyl-terminal hydrolase 23 n=1 Tax=Diospyros lotus TaxID=55363 RepID=UPI002256B1AB|nr:LOW QUALITY PROTEIN: ubiquitin carboxyl-terminal hydrolase 23 [Diospyros lotus]